MKKKDEDPVRAPLLFLVDDEPAVLLALGRSLSQLGYPSKSFATAKEALNALEYEKPTCIVSDYYMPGENGLEFLEKIESMYPMVARVILTGGHVDSRLKKALDDGTIDVLLLKPWSLHTIHALMEHIKAGDKGIYLGSREIEPLVQSKPPKPEDLPGRHAARVLVVDDDPSFLELLQFNLSRIGYRCRCVPDAQDVLEQLAGNEFDVVLLDLLLPGRSGLEAIRLIRESFPNLPLIGMTCSESRTLAVDAYRYGATGFLRKPFELTMLEDTLRRSVQLGRLLSDYLSKPEFQAILELQHAIGSGKGVADILDMLLQQMIRFTGAESASVLLLEPDEMALKIEASYGLDEAVVSQERVAVGERVSGWVAEYGQPQMVIGPATDDPRLIGVVRDRYPSVGLCLPMKGRVAIVGVLCLSRYSEEELFSRDAIDLGLLMCGEVARALERMEAEKERQENERDVMRRDKLVTIGELASGVAHEINNPLGFVNSNVNSLKEYFQDLLPMLEMLAKCRENLDVDKLCSLSEQIDLSFILSDLPSCLSETELGVRRVLKIINDLKNFTRDDYESREMANVNEVIEGALTILSGQLKNKAKLIRNFGDIPPISCFPSQLGQVFLNLLSNAVHAVGPDGKIEVSSKLEKQNVLIEVADNGCGMSEDVRLHVFEPFFTTKPRGVGTGLGLNIARKIVERHGGRLSVTSTPGQGSTFVVSIPLKSANQQQLNGQG